MNETAYRIERLAKHHNRTAFDCGNEILNRFILQTASQWAKKDLSQTYVIVDQNDPETVLGFYSLSATQLDLSQITTPKHLPQAAEVGAMLLGRLAVTRAWQRDGIGRKLLFDAFDRTLDISTQVGIFAVIVDAIDDQAIAYYKHFGFTSFIDYPYRLYYLLKDYRTALDSLNKG